MKIKYKEEELALSHYNRNIKYFDNEKYLNAAITKETFDKLCKKYKINTCEIVRVLDLGCGTGETSVYFMNKVCLCNKYNLLCIDAVDYSINRINVLKCFIANNKYNLINPIICDCNVFIDKCISDNIKFDVIFLFEILEHLKHPDKIIKKCKKLLNINGKILGTIPLQDKPNNIHLSAFKTEKDVINKLKLNIDREFNCRFNYQRIIYYVNK